jgi:hypothetical protein
MQCLREIAAEPLGCGGSGQELTKQNVGWYRNLTRTGESVRTALVMLRETGDGDDRSGR